MQAAALAGLEYTAPQDMQIDMPRTEKVDLAHALSLHLPCFHL